MVSKQDIKQDLYDYTYGDGADLIDHAPEYIEYLLNELSAYEDAMKYDEELYKVLKNDPMLVKWLGKNIIEHAVDYIKRLENK